MKNILTVIGLITVFVWGEVLLVCTLWIAPYITFKVIQVQETYPEWSTILGYLCPLVILNYIAEGIFLILWSFRELDRNQWWIAILSTPIKLINYHPEETDPPKKKNKSLIKPLPVVTKKL